MIEVSGKYNTAKIFTDNVDNATISQIITLLNQEFQKDSTIRIMPDTHAGKGCVIGTTMTIKDRVVPNLVGVDIGCGMRAVKLQETDIDLLLLDQYINQYILAGFDIYDHAVTKFDKLKDIIAPINLDKAKCSIGTLGGGNHFIGATRS